MLRMAFYLNVVGYKETTEPRIRKYIHRFI